MRNAIKPCHKRAPTNLADKFRTIVTTTNRSPCVIRTNKASERYLHSEPRIQVNSTSTGCSYSLIAGVSAIRASVGVISRLVWMAMAA